MLFKVRDIKGTERWINPIYIRLVRWRRNKTELWISGNNMAIIVDRPLDEVANVINAAMPIVDALPAESPDAAEQAAMLTLLASGAL